MNAKQNYFPGMEPEEEPKEEKSPLTIPEGYEVVRRTNVMAGDLIMTSKGWADAAKLGKLRFVCNQCCKDGKLKGCPDCKKLTKWKSAVGNPTALYICVVRRKSC